jgi:3-hydroxyacyl-[acyl-carrier-protein] dehydratase
MAQLGGLVMLDPANQEAKEQFFFGGIEGCRFRRPVVPGDCLVRLKRHVVGARRAETCQLQLGGALGGPIPVECSSDVLV